MYAVYRIAGSIHILFSWINTIQSTKLKKIESDSLIEWRLHVYSRARIRHEQHKCVSLRNANINHQITRWTKSNHQHFIDSSIPLDEFSCGKLFSPHSKHTYILLPHLKQFSSHGPHFEPQITKVNVLQPVFVILVCQNKRGYHTYFVSKTKNEKDRKGQREREKKITFTHPVNVNVALCVYLWPFACTSFSTL